jgi:hypothetical protein
VIRSAITRQVRDPLDHAGTIGLEGGAEVVQRDAGQLGHHPVGDARGQAARPVAIDAVGAPAAGDVVALGELGEQLRQIFRRMLQVAVHGDDHLAQGVIEAGGERGRLAVVAGQFDDADGGIAGAEAAQRQVAAVAAAVIDEDDLVGQADGDQHAREARVQFVERRLFVEDGNDHGQLKVRGHAAGHKKSFRRLNERRVLWQ